jgi:hypothetical protein
MASTRRLAAILGDGVNIAARPEGIAKPMGSASPKTPFDKYAARSRSSLQISASRASRTLPGLCVSTASNRQREPSRQ